MGPRTDRSSAADGTMKDPLAPDKSSQSDQSSLHPESLQQPARLETIYEQCSRFVWVTLQRLGVRQADLDDVCHDVFLIVQRKLPEFERGAKIHAWLFGICARTAANYRRRARIRLEHAGGVADEIDESAESSVQPVRPDDAAARREGLALAEAILSRMSPVKRAVFVMFEVEGMPCHQIAAELGLPVGTVYSRLHSARRYFVEQAARVARAPQGNRHG